MLRGKAMVGRSGFGQSDVPNRRVSDRVQSTLDDCAWLDCGSQSKPGEAVMARAAVFAAGHDLIVPCALRVVVALVSVKATRINHAWRAVLDQELVSDRGRQVGKEYEASPHPADVNHRHASEADPHGGDMGRWWSGCQDSRFRHYA